MDEISHSFYHYHKVKKLFSCTAAIIVIINQSSQLKKAGGGERTNQQQSRKEEEGKKKEKKEKGTKRAKERILAQKSCRKRETQPRNHYSPFLTRAKDDEFEGQS